MLYQTIVDQIKIEARIATDTEFDTLVIGLLNELFKEAIESQRPFELRQDVVLTLTTATQIVAVPDDFFIHHTLEYVDVASGRKYMLSGEDKAILPAPSGLYGKPKSFAISGTNVILKPFDQIVSGDTINLVYYKGVPEVTPDTLDQPNPIQRLEPFLIRGVVRRIRMFHSDDVQVAQMLSGDVGSAAKGYSNDAPSGNP